MPSCLAAAYRRLHEEAPFEPLGREGGGVRRVGRGRAHLVVLPGLIGPADPLAALGDALAETHETAFVTYPRVADLPALLAWLERLREHLGGEPVDVYGGSFGGLIAQAWLRHAPASVAGVVLSGVGPPDAARAVKNARLLPWFARVPMPVWRQLLGLAVRLSTASAPDRALWRAAYRADIAALTWPDLEALYRVSIDIDRAGSAAAGAVNAWSGRMLVLEGARDRVARGPLRAALRAVSPGRRNVCACRVTYGSVRPSSDWWQCGPGLTRQVLPVHLPAHRRHPCVAFTPHHAADSSERSWALPPR